MSNSTETKQSGLWARIKQFFRGAKIELVQENETLNDEQMQSIEKTKEWKEFEASLVEPQATETESPETEIQNDLSINAEDAAQTNPQNDMTREEVMALLQEQTAPLNAKISELEAANQKLTQDLEAKTTEAEQAAKQKGIDKENLLKQQEAVKAGYQPSGKQKDNGLIAPEAKEAKEVVMGGWVFDNEAMSELAEKPIFDNVIKTTTEALANVRPARQLPTTQKR